MWFNIKLKRESIFGCLVEADSIDDALKLAKKEGDSKFSNWQSLNTYPLEIRKINSSVNQNFSREDFDRVVNLIHSNK